MTWSPTNNEYLSLIKKMHISSFDICWTGMRKLYEVPGTEKFGKPSLLQSLQFMDRPSACGGIKWLVSCARAVKSNIKISWLRPVLCFIHVFVGFEELRVNNFSYIPNPGILSSYKMPYRPMQVVFCKYNTLACILVVWTISTNNPEVYSSLLCDPEAAFLNLQRHCKDK